MTHPIRTDILRTDIARSAGMGSLQFVMLHCDITHGQYALELRTRQAYTPRNI